MVPCDKRQSTRMDFKEPVWVQQVGSSKSGNILEIQKTPEVFKAQNLSKDGICLSTDRFFIPHTVLRLNFRLFQSTEVHAYAKVVWSARESCGLQFIFLDPSTGIPQPSADSQS